jgi:GntR family transcriptional regulator, transcriptional repressor for pyruvate dehydrogenase complex
VSDSDAAGSTRNTSTSTSTNSGSKAIGTKVLRPRQQVEEQIKAAILSGTLRSGERLPAEAELARQFEVSRTTVREALRSLSTQNLITKMPGAGGGSFVRSIDHQSLRAVLVDSVHNLLALGSIEFEEVALVRQHLEVPAVRLAAVHRSDEDLETLREIVGLQRSISVDDPRVPALDEQFHGAVARASGNRVLASFVSALHLETEPVHYLDLSPEVGRTTVRQHQRIVRAIADRDPDAGEAAIVEHLTYLREHMLAFRQR